MSAARIDVVVEEPAWKKSGVTLSRVKAAARLALERGAQSRASRSAASVSNGGGSDGLTVLLAGDERLHRLNAQFRDKDRATNVLSFPAPENRDGHLGDIAIAFGVASREAATYGTGLQDHALHLVVHGVLHLLGYDHVLAREARVMERLEIAILNQLGIADPYARARTAV
jgi:probable rRNA maturation factor